MNPPNEFFRTKTKGIEPKNNEKALIKISLKNGNFWEKEYNQNDLIGKVIEDFKQENQEEFPEEYMADWKHKNKSLDFSNEIRTLLVNEIPTVVLDHKDKINPLILGEEFIPDIIGKPFYNPFEIFTFYKNNKILKIQKYDNEEIERKELINYGPSSAYCNGKNKLFISGGEKKDLEIIDKFWIIDLQNQIIEETKMKQPKKNHSMIYIRSNYVFFVGGNDLKTFYYDLENSQMNDWVDLNKDRIEPSLMLINESLYCIDNVNSRTNNDEFTLERTNITNENPEWEIIKPDLNALENQKLTQKFFGVINDKNENIIFLGGNMDEDKNEKYNYKYNINNNNIESSNIPFEEYNFKEKTFLPYNNNVDYILPDFNRNHPEVIFYQKNKNKVSLVKYKPNNENKLRAKPKGLKYEYNFNMPSIISNRIPTSENKYNNNEPNNDGNNNVIVNEEQNIKENINNNNQNSDDENEKNKLLKEEDNQINKSIDKSNEKNNSSEKDINININKESIIQDENKDNKDIVDPSGIKIEIKNSLGEKIIDPITEIQYTNEPPQSKLDSNKNKVINENQEIDINLPVLTKDENNGIKGEDLILLNSKIKPHEMDMEGKEINNNFVGGEKVIGKIDNPPNIKIDDSKLDIKDLHINIPSGNPEIKKPDNNININAPKIDIYSEKYIILSGIIPGEKKNKKEQNIKINGNSPDIKINSPDVNINLGENINLGGNIEEKNKIDLKNKNANVNINKLTDSYMSGIIKGINASSNLNSKNDINLKGPNLKSPNIKIEKKDAELDINGPKINLPSGGGDLNLNKNIAIDGNINNIKISGSDYKLNQNEIGINDQKNNIKNPEIDIPKLKFNDPKLKDGISLNGNLDEKKIKDSNQFDVNLPNVEVKGPKIEGKGNIDLPKIDGKDLNVNFNGIKIDGKNNESTKKEGKGEKFFYISGIIEGTKNKKVIAESKNAQVKGNIPGISVNAPNLDINGNLPNAKINGSKINTNNIGGNINFKGSNGEVVENIPEIDVKNNNNLNLPSTNIQLNGPEINNNINGKNIDLNINDQKIEGPNAKVNLKDWEIPNANLKNSKINGQLDGNINLKNSNKNSNSYFLIEGIIPSKNDKNAGGKMSINAPHININGENLNYNNNKNFHGGLNPLNLDQIGNIQGSRNLNKLNLEGNFDYIKGSRKLENNDGNNNINIQMPKIEINNKDNINLGNSNKIEIGGGEIGGEINLANNIPTKLNFKNDNEDNKLGINYDSNEDKKNEFIDLNNLGMNYNEQNIETKVVLNSSIGAPKRKGRGLPTVGAKSSNFEPSKIDVAGKFDVNNVDTDNLKSANVGINGQKMGERIED